MTPRLNPYLIAARGFADGRRLEVIPLTFGRARLCLVSSSYPGTYDDGW